jgi:hypothetical protein
LQQRQRPHRGPQTPFHAIKQADAQHLLQPRQFAAHRGLGCVQRLGGTRHMARHHHRTKHFNLSMGYLHIKIEWDCNIKSLLNMPSS